MSATNNMKVDEIFSQALALSGEERERFVLERCSGDPELALQVNALLEASQASDDELLQRLNTARTQMWCAVLSEDEDTAEDLSGQRVNVWLLVKRLARGGLATVYLAKRADGAFEQTVAFKVLRRGLDTDDLIARFRAERQMLSSLDHPSIARILDGGALEDGRPYLVLEFVDGLPITAWCDGNNADISDRIKLMVEVLQALSHAHKHLIVHRDIKPPNILVSQEGQAVLLDFGIAKLLDPEAIPGASTLTRTGVSLLTPGYGSPEQVAGLAVTTASDIYQVGQVLYELLAGMRPFDRSAQATGAGLLPPSRALRGTPHYKKVRGDLDAIVGKAMCPDPACRYASADQMIADLQRYLEGRPVLARPDTFRYRMAKLHKRRPWLMPALVTVVLAIGAYVLTLTQYAQRLQTEQRRAEAAQSFMIGILQSADPYAPADAERGSSITVVEAIDLGVERLRSEYQADLELRASLLASIADTYRSLDQPGKAIELRLEALALERELHGNQSEPVLASLAMLANEYKTTGNFAQAAKFYDEQLAVARTLYAENAPALGVAEAMSADFLRSNSRYAASKALLQSAIPKMRNAPHEYAQPLISALVWLAGLLDVESSDEAMALLLEARELSAAAYGIVSLQSAFVHSQTAASLSLQGDYVHADESFQAAISMFEALVGPDHGETLIARTNLGIMYSRMNDFWRAEELHRDVLERYIAKYGSGHRGVAINYQQLASAIGRQGRFAESIPLHRSAFDSYRAVLGDNHHALAEPLVSIAYAELQLGNFEAAEGIARQALGLLEKTSSDNRLIGVAQCLVGLALEGRNQGGEEADMSRRSYGLLAMGTAPEPYYPVCHAPTELR